MLRLELRRMEVLHPGDPGRKRRWDVDHCVSSVLDFFIGIQSSHLIKPSYAILFFFFVLVRTKMSIGWLSRQKLMPHHATRVTDSLIIIIIRDAINIGSTYTKNVNLGSAAAGYSNMGSTALE